MGRRRLISLGIVGGSGWLLAALTNDRAANAARSPSPGVQAPPLLPPNEFGLEVPVGCTARLIATSGEPVGPTPYRWHDAPDGGACFDTTDGGHIYVSNSEVGSGGGGVSALRSDRAGRITDAYAILAGTSRNCSGGATPWQTYLSCEESGDDGRVFECDPFGANPPVDRPALGRFNHEAALVDPIGRAIYLSEDRSKGRLYRMRPTRWPDLTSGVLEAASLIGDAVSGTARVDWVEVSAAAPARDPNTTSFDGGEGLALDGRSLYVTTKGDRRVWRFDLDANTAEVWYDAAMSGGGPLTHVDNAVIVPMSRVVCVAEDGGNMEFVALVPDSTGAWNSVVLVRWSGHDGSEVTGPAFTSDGQHLYLSSQRGTSGAGMTVRISGDFVTLLTDRRATKPPPGVATVDARPRRLGSVGPLRPGPAMTWR